MPEEHARLSASGAKKWLNCPLSVMLESDIPNPSSEFAKEGTTAHSLGEAKLRLAIKELTRVKYHKVIKELEITGEMEEYTDAYRDFVIERFNHAKSKTQDAVLLLEQRLDFSKWVPEGFGTGDVVIIADGSMEVIDLKYGKGVPISADNNPQLRLYALGAIGKYEYLYDIDSVTMTVFQPRIDNISSETLKEEELIKWGDNVKSKALEAFNGVGECIVGTHCDEGFCRAKNICRAYTEERQKLSSYDFKDANLLTDEEIAEVIDQSELLAKWSKAVKEYALNQAINKGVKYPGFKLVEGRSNRTYSSEDKDIIDVLKGKGYVEDDICLKKVRSITDMESFLGKKVFSEVLGRYVIKPQGKPVLVHIEDNRPEFNSAEEDFKNLIEEIEE